MSETLQQFQRVERALKKIENNKNRNRVEYEDDVWSFFQNAWHLKDWIKNDIDNPSGLKGGIEDIVKNEEELKVCADLANRSKHLILKYNIRVDADIKQRNTTVVVGPPGTTGEGFGILEFVISTVDGTKLDAIETAQRIVDCWRAILVSHQVLDAS